MIDFDEAVMDAQDILEEELAARGGHDVDNGICGLCEGALLFQGRLGCGLVYRCRNCGMTHTERS